MNTLEKLVASMSTKAEMAKAQVGEFRTIVRDTTLEEAALNIEASGGMNSTAFAKMLRAMQS